MRGLARNPGAVFPDGSEKVVADLGDSDLTPPLARELGCRRGALNILNWVTDQRSQHGTKVVSVAEREAIHTPRSDPPHPFADPRANALPASAREGSKNNRSGGVGPELSTSLEDLSARDGYRQGSGDAGANDWPRECFARGHSPGQLRRRWQRFLGCHRTLGSKGSVSP